VHSFDQRLMRRARPARRLLLADATLGLGASVLILLQATLLASIVADAFSGASLADVTPRLQLLALTFAGRAVLAWGFEIGGRRAASSVLSELRLALVESRLRKMAGALAGTEAGEVAASAVQGVDALEAYFARYLPQLVLAVLVPLAVVVWVATIDLVSAGLMLVTLPLVPVFMWLIGRYTEERTREPSIGARLRRRRSRPSASATAGRRWRRYGSVSSPARCWSWRRRSGSRSSRSRSASAWPTAASASRRA
jgi:ABC-type multidrug transport system fused ATPase/permease subunit